MSSPFDLPRSDCSYVPTVEKISDCPMLPKPKWTGATSYCDPAFPSGGGPDDVPTAPSPIGQATPADMVPPTQTSMGGGGGGSNIPSILGVIKSACVPGPVRFNRIEVFDDGSWSAIPEPAPSPVTTVGTFVIGSNVVTVPSTVGISSGFLAESDHLPEGTTVTSVLSGTTVQVSNVAIPVGSGDTGPITFTDPSPSEFLTGYVLDRY